jgi:hypothetical protein
MKPEEMLAVCQDYCKRAKKIATDHENAVTSWRLGSHRMISLEPYYDLLDRSDSARWVPAKRRWLESDKKLKGLASLYARMHGFDENGRLLILRSVIRPDIQQYLFYDPQWVDEFSFEEDYVSLVRYEMANGIVQLQYSLFGLRREPQIEVLRYEYEDDRVVRADEESWKQIDGKYSKTEFTQITKYQFSDDGGLERVTIDRFKNGTFVLTENRFSRPLKVDVTTLLNALEELLVQSIPAVIRQANIKHELSAAMLAYCGEDITTDWPGSLLLLSKVVRDELVAKHGAEASTYIWSPDEWNSREKTFDMFDAASRAKYEQLRTSILASLSKGSDSVSSQGEKTLRSLLHRVALRLNQANWRDAAKLTDDFVVAAVDNTLEYDYRSDVKASLPKPSFELLKRRKLI